MNSPLEREPIQPERTSVEESIKSRLRAASRKLRIYTALGAASTGVAFAADIKPVPFTVTPALVALAARNNRRCTAFCNEQVDAYEAAMSSLLDSADRYHRTKLVIKESDITEKLELDEKADIERTLAGTLLTTELFSIGGSSALGILSVALIKNGLPPIGDLPVIGGIEALAAGITGHGLYLGSERLRMIAFQRQLDNIDSGPVSISSGNQ